MDIQGGGRRGALVKDDSLHFQNYSIRILHGNTSFIQYTLGYATLCILLFGTAVNCQPLVVTPTSMLRRFQRNDVLEPHRWEKHTIQSLD
ncbi:hypothetical protein ACTXT7_009769 [Hymenolepis weldensis]